MSTKLYVTTASGGTIPKLSSNTQNAGPANQLLMSTTKSGAAAATAATETSASTWRASQWRAVSSAFIASGTVDGTVSGVFTANESDAAADATLTVFIGILKADTSVVLLTSQTSAELPTTYTGIALSFTLPSTAVAAGDRLLVEAEVTFANTLTSSKFANVVYGGTGPDVAGGATTTFSSDEAGSYLTFNSTNVDALFSGGGPSVAVRTGMFF